jgi:ABC-type transport system substrate-binding protein
LAAFDQHWRGRPKIDHLVWVPVKENATRVQRLARGEVHVAENITPVELDELAKNPRLAIQEETAMNVAYLTMQVEKPPLDNVRVREAIYRAIDKATLIKVGYNGHAQPAHSLVPPAMWGHAADLADLKHDPARAKELLAEAAAEAGFTLPLRLSLSVMSQARPYLQQPEAIRGYLKDALAEIGIELTIEPRDVNQHFEHLMAGRHQLGLAGWNSDNSDPDNFLYSLLDPDNIAEQGNNLSRWRNERFHELMLAGQRELDESARLAIYREAQEIVLKDLPVVPLVHTRLRAAHAKELKGYKLHPTGLIRLRGAYFEEQPAK